MARGMKRPLLVRGMLPALICMGHTSGWAQSLPDPTRPPATYAQGVNAEETVRDPVLQSIIITPQHRLAVIDGQRVELGARFGDARLIRITDTEAVLVSARGRQVLKLFPDVHMKSTTPGPETRRQPRRERN